MAQPAQGAPDVTPPAGAGPPQGFAGQGHAAPAWASSDLLRAAVLVLGTYVVLQLLWLVHPVLLTAFLGLLFGLVAARGADYLERLHVPRGLGAALTVLGIYALIVAGIAVAAPTLQAQFAELRSHLPEATDRLEQWLSTHQGQLVEQLVSGEDEAGAGANAAPGPAGAGGAATPAQPGAVGPAPSLPADAAGRRAGRLRAGRPSAGLPAASPASGTPPAAPQARAGATPGAGQPGAPGRRSEGARGPEGAQGAGGMPSHLRRTLSRQLGAASRYLFPFISSTVEVVAGMLLITFTALYFSIDPGLYRRGLIRLLPPSRRNRADEVLSAIGATLRRWMMTQGIAMLTIGVALTLTLWLLGVRAALSLGIIAGLLEFIPTIGPILAALPAIAMGFLVSPEKALAVALACLVIQQLEGHLLIPLLMKQGMDLPPLLTILGQALMAVVFGFLGLLIAVPLVATLVVAVKMLYIEDVLGDAATTGTGAGR